MINTNSHTQLIMFIGYNANFLQNIDETVFLALKSYVHKYLNLAILLPYNFLPNNE
ncbi:hypothetical protein VCHA37P192_110129 [Vibrio chagasii]|nr:hypothetical protein VCHA37P192_110129 [Vibrio chagasii]